MNDGTTVTKGYYSILQYIPDPERAEGMNIGLMLFCPEKAFLKIQMTDSNDRVRKLLGKQRSSAATLSRLDSFKTAFAERVDSETDRIQTLDEFRAFINTRANQLRLTDPRPLKVADPEAELSNLFRLLVDDKASERAPTQRATTAIKKQFGQLLAAHHLDEVVTKNFPIELPMFGRRYYPFHFRNGVDNVIEPESFESLSPKETTERACRLLFEGQKLNQQASPIKLNVISSFKPSHQEQIKHVRDILAASPVALYTVDEMDKLIRVITETAHV